MELLDYGVCQFVHLFSALRPQGSPYTPELAAKVVAKYQFAKPPALDDLTKETIKFGMGRFNDVQIGELGVYSDGIIVNGRCPTETLVAFWDDIFSFVQQEFQYRPILSERNETHFETTIVVKSDTDLAAFLMPRPQEIIAKTIHDKIGFKYQPSGIAMDCDPLTLGTRRKPSRVLIERRLGFKFEENIFLCIGPLQTKDFMDLLSALEREALRSTKK